MSRKNNGNNKSTKSVLVITNPNSNNKISKRRGRSTLSNERKITLVNNLQRGAQRQKSVAAAYASGQVGKAPAITQTRDNCRIVHRELIASVSGSDGFTVAGSYPLNPGMTASFPWLASMAQSWEQYKFHKLRYCYYTRTGSTTPGSMMLAPDYDAADTPPVSEQIASSFEDVAEDAPWKDIVCNLPVKRLHSGLMGFKYLRRAALANNLDIKTYDAGQLHVITLDGTNVPWGKLWVEYDVEFKIPQLPSLGVEALSGGTIFGSIGGNAGNPLGPNPIIDAQSVGLSADATSLVTIAEAGTYLFTYVVTGTGLGTLQTAPGLGVSAISAFTTVTNAAGTAAIFTAPYLVGNDAGGNILIAMTAALTLTSVRIQIAQGIVGAYG
jgi:hypothetical protein